MQIISGYRNIYTQVDRNAPRVGVGRPHLAPDAGRGASPLTGAGCSGSASGARHALVCDSPRVAGSMGSPARRRAIGSAGERLVHTEEVTGSIPVSPTRSQSPDALRLGGPPGAQSFRRSADQSSRLGLSYACSRLG